MMSDIIQLLPDSVANQIAAGEVVQRPASVVKELLENAIDAGASEIQLIIKDAGRTLVQTIDNGCGMSETDARMCFERHATSKIKKAEDLLSIRTLGFRGEAMASIAAVAQVELRSKRSTEELGTEIFIEGSVVKSQQPCSAATGTSISVKNLFFNVPARRKFLKSENVELRHIIDEFTHVAMVNSKIRMEMIHNGKQVFSLPKSTIKERIINLMGNHLSSRLLPIDTETDYVSISGFIGKPEFAKKNRGEQFFFVNHRYIRSPFLHHAIENACQQLLPENSTPSYFIFFEMDPENIDINIHPTKTEVKFTNEQMVYQFLMAAVKQSIGQYNITPSLDFDNPLGADFIPTRSTAPTSMLT
ncbi:MAG: DNA mismatch repair endonuclease MutL, partial [Bacteroidales bacterium]|nr:DNA mismatch repair endonuclease MutL [Bacteroidales bacterium]